MSREVIFRHRKTGGLYRMLGPAKVEADLSDVLVYQNIKTGERWVRPTVEFNDGRFEVFSSDEAPRNPFRPGEHCPTCGYQRKRLRKSSRPTGQGV